MANERDRAIAVIPARGGSKRIPKKNARNFQGRPIISYIIEAAFSSNLFSEVVVSTDSLEIKELAESYGATVPWIRASQLADDFSTTDQVVVDAISNMNNLGHVFQDVACLYATTPFIEGNDLVNAFQIFKESKIYPIMAVTKTRFPIERAYRELIEGVIAPINIENYLNRSQDFAPTYLDAGQFYFASCEMWSKIEIEGLVKAKYYELPWYKSIDIDTEEDWEMAELIFRTLKK